MRNKLSFGILLIGMVFIANSFGQTQIFNPVKFPADYVSKIDQVYTKVGDWEGRLDLYYNLKSSVPLPILINIHGGGWNHGDKESQTGFGSFFKNGFAVANIEYRLVADSEAPGAIEDVRCALIFILENAENLNIDPNKIVIMGSSSGGHLALMAGLLGNHNLFDSNCHYSKPIKVAAVIDKYGVTDLEPLVHWKSAKNWLGKNVQNIEFIKSVSPINYVTAESPTVFIVHGTQDPIVPFNQSAVLYEKLKSKGVTTKMISIADGLHGKFTDEQNKKVSTEMWAFLKNLNL